MGGGQERGLRPGTENLAGIVASAKAFRMAVESQADRYERMHRLRDRLLRCVEQLPELILNGSAERAAAAPQIVNFSYPGMKPEVVIHMLEKHRILASTKSACSSKDDKPSRILEAMGLGRGVQQAAFGLVLEMSMAN